MRFRPNHRAGMTVRDPRTQARAPVIIEGERARDRRQTMQAMHPHDDVPAPPLESVRARLLRLGLIKPRVAVAEGDPSPQGQRHEACLRLDTAGQQAAARELAGQPARGDFRLRVWEQREQGLAPDD